MSAFIHAIGTALPPYVTDQISIADFMVRHLQLNQKEEKQLSILYRASGIQKRYSVLEDFSNGLNRRNFFNEEVGFPSVKSRMILYQQHALGLGEQAVSNLLHGSRISKEEITHLITVSCTGMYAPGLDIELIQSLGLPTDTQRTSINFMGCYAAFNALKVASSIVNSSPDTNVLVVCVELCSIHLQEKKDNENLLANTIFGDGAAAMIINSKPGKRSLEMKRFYSDLMLQGKNEMGWYIGNHGFEMKISGKVPNIISEGIDELTNRLLKKIDLDISDIDFFAIHPGGKRILKVIEEKLNISKEQNQPAREILKTHGNMSSPTILFVIKSIFETMDTSDHNKYLLNLAFGPGLTMESALFKARIYA